MATIYLVRHGQASFGAANYDQLSALGQRQADVTGEYFKRTGVEFDAVYSGDLSRQRETCQRVIKSQNKQIEHHIDPRFNEINNDEQVEHLSPLIAATDPLVAEIMERGLGSSKDYQKVIRAVFNYWVTQDCSEHGIQSWADYSGRASQALRDVMDEQGAGKTVGIFTSGGTIATLTAAVLGLDSSKTYSLYEPIFNCSVTQLFYSGDKISVSYFNDRSFLQMLGLENEQEYVSYR